ncbi:MAG: hypothetical protein GC154_10765 [bacterium]|nr:hypothetical protein [bacterium]
MKNDSGRSRGAASLRETLNQLIRRVLGEMAEPAITEPHLDEASPSARDREAFFAATADPWRESRSASPLIESWSLNAPRPDWFAQAQAMAERLGQKAGGAVRRELESLRDMLDVLSGRLVPAPSYRGAAPTRMAYPPQRRSLPAADLPAFHPLFCTAIDPEEGPIHINGLNPRGRYRCVMSSPQRPGWTKESALSGAVAGGFQLDFSEALSADGVEEIVWIIEEICEGRRPWISGMVWTAPPQSSQPEEFPHDLHDSGWQWDRVKTLMEIIRLQSGERFVEAYETARRALRVESARDSGDGAIPFQEALWLTIDRSLTAMTDRLNQAEPVLRGLKPEWNAIAQLSQLKREIAG